MAPDGGERGVGDVRIPDPPALRGPSAGVPDVTAYGLEQLLAGGRAGAPDDALIDPLGDPLIDPLGDGIRPSETCRFQHISEARFARLLDFYGIAWQYEPDEFAISWDDVGVPTGFFRPDFRLPAFDTYIEITTSSQRLVTKKNRKIRALREHHPQVSCKLFYQHDYLVLLREYGLDDGPEGDELEEGGSEEE